MKSNSLTSILLGVLTISTLASVVLTMIYSSKIRELRTMQAQVTAVNNNRNNVALFVNELVEYSKRNPALDPLLETAGLKPPKGGATGTTNAKPVTR